MLDEIKWFFEDYMEQIGTFILSAFVIVGAFFLVNYLSQDPNEYKPNSEEQIAYMESVSEELKESFSLLSEQNQGTEEYPILMVDLYLKKPYMIMGDIEMKLEQYVNLEKNKYNVNDTKIRAIRFQIYDRKAVWEQNLKPKGTFEYRLSTEENPKTSKKNDETVIGGNDTGVEEQTIQEIAWDNTTITQKKDPDYDKYVLEGDFHPLTKSSNSEPLTDQEFEWFLKYDVYQTLGDGPSLYLAWELGVEPTESDMRGIQKQFDTFVTRLSEMNDFTSYNSDNVDKLKRDLVISNPQLLYYATTGKVLEDEYEARQALVKDYPELYKDTVNDWLDEQALKLVNEQNSDSASSDKDSETEDIKIDSSYDAIVENESESESISE